MEQTFSTGSETIPFIRDYRPFPLSGKLVLISSHELRMNVLGVLS